MAAATLLVTCERLVVSLCCTRSVSFSFFFPKSFICGLQEADRLDQREGQERERQTGRERERGRGRESARARLSKHLVSVPDVSAGGGGSCFLGPLHSADG
jgi:hypothetical protein